jgi:hypothetical protein
MNILTHFINNQLTNKFFIMKKNLFTFFAFFLFSFNLNAGYFGFLAGEAYVKINGTTYNITSGISVSINAPVVIENLYIKTEKQTSQGNACGGSVSWSGTNVTSGSAVLSYDSGFGNQISGSNTNQQWIAAPNAIVITQPGTHTINFVLSLTGNDNANTGCGTTKTTNLSQSILPIELKKLSANVKENNVIINWVTSSERDNASFEIERSSNGIDFTNIGSVKGAGNSFQEKQYSFQDKSPLHGINYYRLRSISYSGESEVTFIISVKSSKNLSIIGIAPNPATSSINIEYEAQKDESSVNIQVYDVFGKVQVSSFMDLSEGINILPLEISQLAVGSYFIKVRETVVRFEKN